MKTERTKNDIIVDTTVDRGRRKAMGKIAVGVGVLAGYSILPEQWTKPIIGQIVLPAHAGTSGSTLHDPCTITLTAGDQGTTSVTVLVSGFVTPPTNNVPIHIVAGATGGANQLADADTQTDEDGNYSVSLTLGGGPNITGVAVTTTATGVEGTAECSVSIGAPSLQVLTQCTMNISSGDQAHPPITFGVIGSVNPPAAGVPIHIDITTTGGAGQFTYFDVVTIAGGTYDAGTSFNGAPPTRITAVVTSTVVAGSTTCSYDVPNAT